MTGGGKMKIFFRLIFAIVVLYSGMVSLPLEAGATAGESQISEDFFTAPLAEKDAAFVFLGFSGILVRTGGQTILFDPAGLIKAEDLEQLKTHGLDLMLFTHGHGDHLNLSAAKNIFQATSCFVAAEPSIAGKLQAEIPEDKLISAEAGGSFNAGDIKVDAVQGVHIGPIMLFRVTVKGNRIFHAGDSSYISLKDYSSDLAFLPTGNPSPTASPEKAFQMAMDLRPQIAVTMHGSGDQNSTFEQLMKDSLGGVEVIIAATKTWKKVSLK
jgi:L-ascorbate metabolism protein UlaG (beta-lactamase superfamily)